MVLRELLKLKGSPFSIIDCQESFSTRLIFQRAAHDLSRNEKMGIEDDLRTQKRIATNLDFIHFVNSHFAPKETLFLVFDQAEKLLHPNFDTFLSFILRLDEWTERSICTILVSTLNWQSFTAASGSRDPILIFFLRNTLKKC